MIFIEHVTVYDPMGKKNRLNDVSLSISKGSICGFFGPKGSGKNTLLKTINGLVLPDVGTVRINQQKVNALTEKEIYTFRKNIAFLQQRPLLLPHLTLIENILLPLENMPIAQKPGETSISELLAFFDLQGLEHNYPKQLSKEQMYQAALARSLVTAPCVLLIEEVGEFLAPENRQPLFLLLEKWNKQHQTTIIVSTNDVDTIKEFCNQGAILKDGTLLEVSDPYQLISAPSHPLTAELLSKHLPFDLPKEVQQRAFGTIVLIEYAGDEANEPVLYEVSQRFGVEYNILQGRIEYIRGRALGKMYVSFNSEPELMPAVLEYLSQNTHHVEVVQHD